MELVFRRNHDLCRGGRGRCAQIGDEVGDRKIRLVTHGGNDGNVRCGDGPCHRFVVKCPKVFDGAAAAGQNDHIRSAAGVEPSDGANDLRGCQIALNVHPNHFDGQIRKAPVGDVDEIANRGAGG